MPQDIFQLRDFEDGLSCRCFAANEATDHYVFILPGGPGLHSGYLDDLAAGLSVDLKVRVFVFDLPGHQRHAASAALLQRDVGFMKACSLIDARIRSLSNGKRSFLIGHSFGALLTHELLRRDSNSFTGACLVSLPIADETSEQYEELRKQLNIPSSSDDSEVGFRSYWRRIIPLYFNREPSIAELEILSGMTFSKQGECLLNGVVFPDKMSKCEFGDIPVLVVQGNVDHRLPEHNLLRLKSIMNKAVFVALPNVGHFPMLEAPRDFLEVIKKFVNSKKIFL